MNVFSLSFGKDSMATLILAAEQGIPIDHVMYCDIRFSDEISGEHPLMAEWIPEAERILKERFGITVEHVSNGTYLQHFFTKKQKGKYVGSSMSFPLVIGAWCNSRLKIAAISKYLSQFKKQTITQFVGIAYDEPRRWEGMQKKNKLFIVNTVLCLLNRNLPNKTLFIFAKNTIFYRLYILVAMEYIAAAVGFVRNNALQTCIACGRTIPIIIKNSWS